MSEINICRRHGLSPKKARLAVESIARELASEFDIDYLWNGDILEFSRTGVQGTMTVSKKEVHIKARLGFLLAVLRTKIEDEVHRVCDETFGPDHAGKPA